MFDYTPKIQIFWTKVHKWLIFNYPGLKSGVRHDEDNQGISPKNKNVIDFSERTHVSECQEMSSEITIQTLKKPVIKKIIFCPNQFDLFRKRWMININNKIKFVRNYCRRNL